MKTIIALAFTLAVICGQAQTFTNLSAVPDQLPPAKWNLASLFSGGIGTGIKQGAKDAIAFVEGTTNNGVITVETGALYSQRTKAVGGFLDVYLPVGGTNSVFGAGFGVAYLDDNFYDATMNARLGDTFNLPFVHVPLYAYIESGGGYNLSQNQVIAQAFSGAILKIPVTATQTLTIGGAVGTISDYAGNIFAFGASYTFHF